MRKLFAVATMLLFCGCSTSGSGSVPVSRDTGAQPTTSAVSMAAEMPPSSPVPAQLDSDESSTAGVRTASSYPRTQYHEFQVNCPVTRHGKDDPIVFPGQPGASHEHSFFGNTTTNAFTTEASLDAATTSCQFAQDKSAYWTPTLFSNGKTVDPDYLIVYYKSGVDNYPAVRPFPPGLKLLAGYAMATSPQSFSGTWSCGDTHNLKNFPTTCPTGSKLIARLKAPSCWDGKNLDSLNHRDHIAYPVAGACPSDHPVALPMLEFKVSYPVNGSAMQLALASGQGYTFHEDFINAWQDSAQATLVTRCINGGRQCGPSGFDPHKP